MSASITYDEAEANRRLREAIAVLAALAAGMDREAPIYGYPDIWYELRDEVQRVLTETPPLDIAPQIPL